MIRLDFTLDNIPYIEEGIALTLGYFDGLHIGHLSIILNICSVPFLLSNKGTSTAGITSPAL